MKKIILLAWLLLLFTACQKNEDQVAPADQPDARLNKVLTDYKALLTGAEHGWKAVLVPGTNVEYHFLLKFTPNDRVVMTSDINASTAAPLESSFRLKAMQQPALLFDTYSYLHILADPDPAKSNGEGTDGQFSDFEFTFDSATPETITLRGQYHGSKLVLTKATAADANYINNFVSQVAAWEKLNTFTTYFKRLTIGAKAYDIQVNHAARTLAFSYFVGETLNIFTTRFSYTEQGLVLAQPFTHEGLSISTLQGLQFIPDSRHLTLTINNEAATIQEAAQPVKVDVQGARNFFNSATGNNYWVSETGFTVEGVPDAFKIRSLPNFIFLALWPLFGNPDNETADLLAFVKPNAAGDALVIAYGPFAASQVTAEGRIVYKDENQVRGQVPPGEEAAVTATKQLWTQPEGFYVVWTGNTTLDLVSARDGKAWLSLTR
jgi:Domain of unknown function (DUF4302)